MNRLEMAQKITERLPYLLEREHEELKKCETLRKQFLADYPVSRIQNLALDEFVIGKGGDNKSFCYRLEQELDSLGRIRGGYASKFGIYYSKTKQKYVPTSYFGPNLTPAFRALKQTIVDLVVAAERDDIEAIRGNRLSPMFKGKLLFLHHPDQYAPIYSKLHLEHFVAELNLKGTFECEVDMQRALMAYRKEWPELLKHSPIIFMSLLYDFFGYPYETTPTGDEESAPLPPLDKALEGAEFITEIPISKRPNARRTRDRKIDYEKHNRQLKRIGNRGEVLVVEMERRNLHEAGKPKLAEKVDYIAERDDSAGYDV